MSKILFAFLLLTCGVSLRAETIREIAVAWNRAIDASEELRHQGKFEQARTLLLRAIETDAKYPGQLAVAYNNLGAIAQDQGKYADAERYYRQAIRQWESVPDGDGKPIAMNNLATLLNAVGKLDVADRIQQRAEALQIEANGPNHPNSAAVIQNRATLYLAQRQYRKAESGFRRAIETWEHLGAHDLEIADAFRGLAIVCSHTGRGTEAALLNSRAIEIWTEQVASGYASPQVRVALSHAYLEKKMPLKAEPVLSEAVRLSQADPDYPLLVPILRMYATVFRETGRKAEAREIEARAKAVARGCSQVCMARLTISASDFVAGNQSR